MEHVIFDIETGPLPRADLEIILAEKISEIERKKPDSRLKDADKVQANLLAIETDYQRQVAELYDRAALSAETGLILAVGFHFEGSNPKALIFENKSSSVSEEKIMLEGVLKSLEQTLSKAHVVGHNVKNFDIPFIVRRCMRHGIWSRKHYERLFEMRGRPWTPHFNFIDTMEAYACGEYGRKVSLNTLGRMFGCGEKTGSKDEFKQWWEGGDRERARAYLRQDLQLCHDVAKRMGILHEQQTEDNKPL